MTLPDSKDDLVLGLWQIEQRAQANLPDRAVLRHIHELHAKLTDSEAHAAAWQAQVTEYQGCIARLEAMNAEINAKWRDERVLLLDGERARYAFDTALADDEHVLEGAPV